MKFLKKLVRSQNVIIFCLLIFNAVIFAGAVVRADYPRSAANNNFGRIDSVETNSVLADCPVSTLGGIVGDGVDFVSELLSGSWRDESCEMAKQQAAVSAGITLPARTTANDSSKNVSVLDALSIINTKILEQRPASGQDFIQQKVFALTNPGKVYAQEPQNYFPGLGYDLLKPIYGFWGWSVNIVYGVMILIIIGIALAIIFRENLGGAQSITIQQAIPNIAMAMILIPLSYAITGLFIDAITLGTNATHDFLIGPNAPGSFVYTERDPKLVDCAPGGTIDDPCDRGLYADDYRVDWFRARERIDLRDQAGGIATSVATTTGLTSNSLFNTISGLLNGIFGVSGGGWTSVAWFGSLINLAISILTIWIGVKIFVKLFMKYLLLIISPMFAPFVFATVAIPGRGTKAIVEYAKSLGSASLFYIVTYAMFLLTFIFTSPEFQAQIPDIRTGGYIPPLLSLQYILNGAGTAASGASSTSVTNLLFTLVGLGIYYSIPKILEDIDSTLGTNTNPLMKYIQTPIDSFKESWKVTTRTAPALAARASIAASRGVKNVAYSPFRAATAVGDLSSRLRGRDPESDPRSFRNKRRESLGKKLAELQEKYENTTDPLRRARLQAEMTAVRASGDLWGTGAGYQGKTEDKPQLTVKFIYKNSSTEGTVTFQNDDAAAMVSRGGRIKDLPAGELEFELTGNLKFDVQDVIEYAGIAANSATGRIDDPSFGSSIYEIKNGDEFLENAESAKGGTGRFLEHARFNFEADDGSSLKTKGGNGLYPDADRKKIKVKVALNIADAADFFGSGVTVGGRLVLKGGDITPIGGKPKKSYPLLFRLKNKSAIKTSKPLVIEFKVQV